VTAPSQCDRLLGLLQDGRPQRPWDEFVRGLPRLTAGDRARFLSKIEFAVDGCWLWTGAVLQSGYPRIQIAGEAWPAHRVAYALFVGSLDRSLTLDHLCRVRRCCNPKHLEQVSPSENKRRGYDAQETCRSGRHPWDPENPETTYTDPRGGRFCRQCMRDRLNSYRRRRRKALCAAGSESIVAAEGCCNTVPATLDAGGASPPALCVEQPPPLPDPPRGGCSQLTLEVAA